MKIVAPPSAGSVPAAVPPAVDRAAELRELQNQLATLRDEVRAWREKMEERFAELRSAAQPAASAATEEAMRNLQALSERVRGLEQAREPGPEQLTEEIRAICRREMEALDQRVTAALTPGAPGPNEELAALQTKLAEQAGLWEKRFKEDEQALEDLRRTVSEAAAVKEAAPPAPPVPEAPAKAAEPEAAPSPSRVAALLIAAPRPSLWKRFWRYMNAPAFGDDR